jgi:hypothetical protein
MRSHVQPIALTLFICSAPAYAGGVTKAMCDEAMQEAKVNTTPASRENLHNYYIDRVDRFCLAATNQAPQIGMDPFIVLNGSNWGQPYRVEKRQTVLGATEVWRYETKYNGFDGVLIFTGPKEYTVKLTEIDD